MRPHPGLLLTPSQKNVQGWFPSRGLVEQSSATNEGVHAEQPSICIVTFFLCSDTAHRSRAFEIRRPELVELQSWIRGFRESSRSIKLHQNFRESQTEAHSCSLPALHVVLSENAICCQTDIVWDRRPAESRPTTLPKRPRSQVQLRARRAALRARS